MRKFIDSEIIKSTKNMTPKEWLEARKDGIGGSDASSVLGLNPYRSVVSVYMDKISIREEGYKEEKDLVEMYNNIVQKNKTYKMELGNKLEDFVAKEFANKTGKKVRNINGILKNPKYSFAIANIDRAIVGEKAFLECRVTNSFAKKEWQKEVPIYTQIQVYHYMAVSGATHAYVAALIGNEELIIHKLERDDEVIDAIMKAEEEFWKNYILGDDMPNPDGSVDYSKYLKERYNEPNNESILLFLEESKLTRYDKVNNLIKELEVEKKAIEQFIQSQMGNYEIAYVGERRITWKNVKRSRLDTKRLKEDYPELAEKYTVDYSMRVLKI